MTTNPLSQMLGMEEYSDLVIACQGEEFRVHKVIICAQSSVIKAALSGDFQEAKRSVLQIEFDIDTVRRMIGFMYTFPQKYDIVDAAGDLNNKVDGGAYGKNKPPAVSEAAAEMMTADLLQLHMKMNAIADYYDIPRLGAFAIEKMGDIFKTNWSADDFLDVARRAPSLTGDKALHHYLASAAAEHIEELVSMERFAELDFGSPGISSQ